MKNEFLKRQRQIEKSIRNDYYQNVDWHEDMSNILIKKEKRKYRSKLVIINGKLVKKPNNFSNGIPTNWDDLL